MVYTIGVKKENLLSPNVVLILCRYKSKRNSGEKYYYLIEEFLEGRSLDSYSSRKKLSHSQIISIHLIIHL